MSVASPCINVCTLDPTGRVCLGCFRTIDEIASWGALGEAERARVVDAAQARRASASLCDRCGAQFVCGAGNPAEPCWCLGYPPVAPEGPAARCLCPACLAAAARSQTSP